MLVDLQDVGARYYTFIWTMYLCMRACEKRGVAVVVLDRPNPINGVTTEGPLLDANYKSFVGMHPIPVRHGRTIGELAQQFRDEAFPECRLSILPMKNWEREMWFDQTGLPWVMPSPNMPTLDTATVYPGMCLLEGTNISEGRGTTRPFEIFGAPFIDAEQLCSELNSLRLPGVFFRENYFQPTFHKFAGELCGGAQLHVTDRETFQPFHNRSGNHQAYPQDLSEQFHMETTALRIRMETTSHRNFDRRSNRIAFRRLIARDSPSWRCRPVPQLRADIPWPEVVQRLAYENEKLARRPQGHNGEYFVVCTLYYTPKESGFTFERGFDATPVTKPWIARANISARFSSLGEKGRLRPNRYAG